VTETAETVENPQNISELIFQFSQKIALYNESQAKVSENANIEQERAHEATSNMQM
jgi:hypothetical protein